MTSPAAILLLAFVTLILIVICFIIYPIMSFVHCVRNPALSWQSKVAWGCLIFFAWTLGACIYGIIISGRPFYRYLGVFTLLIFVAVFFLRKPLERKRLALEAQRQTLESETQLSYTQDLERYKPIYQGFGMAELYPLMKSGRCAEAQTMADRKWPAYMQAVRKKGAPMSEKDLRKAVDDGIQLCKKLVLRGQTP
jgi:hypothetical protein